MKNIIICADDYAQNEFISHAIIDLIKAERLSAVSCMTASDQWHIYGKKLLNVASKIDVGLHFDLTHFDSVSKLPFYKLLLTSCCNRIDLRIIEQQFNDQLDKFEIIMRRAPDYIDGHQHVHILPNIRECLLHSLKRRYGNNLPYLRQVNPKVLKSITPFKAFVLRLLASGFKSLATRQGFQLSKHFFGIYSLKPMQYSLLFKAWLNQAPNHSLIMCHPGYISTDSSDSISAARVVEFNYLASEEFLQDLKENNIRISRFKISDPTFEPQA
jgi:predicted glycoside hydrolase/deacetylase ChbG (UPF0249 family)